ncbi:hypothetical protein D770_02420 [Flammeovirgaceae bacterium 311]|nr:hypothetical protein D770_02420 [Flammeovirgaceae bacterium 311]
MRHNLLLLLLFCAPQILLAQGGLPQFSATDVREDLKYMYSTLEKAHYNLYAFVPKKRHDAVYKQLAASITADSLNLLETTRLLQRFAATGNVGHCEVDFPVQPYIAYAQKGGTVFPLELAFEVGRAYVRKNHGDSTQVQVGSQVLSINGIPIQKLLRHIHPYLSAERPYFKDVKVEFFSFPRLYWSAFGEQPSFHLNVIGTDGKVATPTLKAITVMDYETRRGGELLSSDRTFRYLNGAAYISPGGFSSSEADGESKFKAFIDSAFTDIRSKGTPTLIVDLRNNAGGHNAYSDHLLAYLADKPFKWHSSFSVKTSAVLKEQTRRQADTTDAFSLAILRHPDGAVFPFEFEPYQPVAAEKRYRGKVYVLINRQTHSMAAVAAAQVKDYGFGILAGEETGDVPTTYASQFSFELPRTGITVKLPKSYFVRPSGDDAVKGVQPDVVVRDHLLGGRDEVLEKVLGMIN